MGTQNNSIDSSNSSALAAFFRLYLILFGPGGAFIISMTMLLRKNSHIIGASIIFWVLILSLICVRYVDIKYYKGKTKDFEPATMSHWRKYTLSLLGIAAVLWIVSAATGAGMIFK